MCVYMCVCVCMFEYLKAKTLIDCLYESVYEYLNSSILFLIRFFRTFWNARRRKNGRIWVGIRISTTNNRFSLLNLFLDLFFSCLKTCFHELHRKICHCHCHTYLMRNIDKFVCILDYFPRENVIRCEKSVLEAL